MFFSGRYSVLYRTFKRAIGKNLNCHFKEVVSAISFFVSKYSSHIYYILDGLIFAQIQKEQFLCSRPFVILLETQKRKGKINYE